jgi:RNA polymerase sigma-70 factor, ECF subfamily
MDGKKSITDLEELMQHASWIRNLAYANLRDYALAEDVSQEVLLKALAEPRRTGQVLKAWLAAVTFNTAKNEIRGNSRRWARELKVAQRNRGVQQIEQLDIMQTHRELTYVVEALSPNHREVIVLRFYEECRFKEIGELLQITEGAARVRLHRALQEMRRSMEQSGRDWKAHCLLLAPSAGKLAAPLSLLTPSKHWMLASVVVFCGAIVLWKMMPHTPLAIKEPIVVSQVVASGLVVAVAPEVQKAHKIDRMDWNPPDKEAVLDIEVEKETRVGRVFFQGDPVIGAEVKMWQAGEFFQTTSLQDGSFDFQMDSKTIATVAAFHEGMARMVHLRPLKADDGPVLIHLLPPPEEGTVIVVRDGETGKPIPNATLDVFLDWSSVGSSGPWLRENSVEQVAHGITDADGRFVAPAWLADSSLIGRATAEGYAPNDCALKKNGDTRIVRLFRGEVLPVQLVYLDGAPVADVELRQGERVREIQRTTADGFLPSVAGWGHAASADKVHALPDFIFLRLPSGRIWFQYSYEIPDHQVEVLADRIRITVDDTPLRVQLDDIHIPEGSWVEARSIYPYFADVEQDLGESRWQRLVVGETVVLESGWTGGFSTAQARLMPAKISIGEYEASEGLVIIDQMLHRISVSLEGPSVDSGKELELVFRNQHGKYHSACIPFANGAAEFYHPAFRLEVSIETVMNHQRLLLENEWGVYLDYQYIQIIDQDIAVTLHEVAAGREKILIRMNGIPVIGGRVNQELIDLNGVCVVPLDEKLNPLVQNVVLNLPASLHRQSGGPILSGFSVAKDSAFPGRLYRNATGQVIWDLELALVELLSSASNTPASEHGQRVTFPKGRLFSALHWPASRKEGTWSTPILTASSKGGWLAFRVPAGRYAMKIGQETFGGSSGVDCPAGEITQLYPDQIEDSSPGND